MTLQLFGYDLTPIHVDALSLVWGYIFHIAAFLAALFALHVKDSVQHVSALMYVGAAIGAVFAGDLITLFVWAGGRNRGGRQLHHELQRWGPPACGARDRRS